MITLLHGDNTTASRAELIRRIEEAKKAGKEIRQLDGKGLDTLTLTQALESSSLFGGDILVVIEKFITRGTKLPATNTDVIIWEDKEIGKTGINGLGAKVSVQLFKTPVVIWEFLDRLTLTLLHKALERDAPELIFSLLVGRIRQLIMLKDNVTPEGLPGWQAARLTRQARLFTMDKLLAMERKLLEIEVSIKTGSSPFTLAQHLELWLLI